jgi:hypothetical protein
MYYYNTFAKIEHKKVSLTDSETKCDQLINTKNCQLTGNCKSVNGNTNID